MLVSHDFFLIKSAIVNFAESIKSLLEDTSLEIGYVLHKAPDLRKELIQKYGIKQTANSKIGQSFKKA